VKDQKVIRLCREAHTRQELEGNLSPDRVILGGTVGRTAPAHVDLNDVLDQKDVSLGDDQEARFAIGLGQVLGQDLDAVGERDGRRVGLAVGGEKSPNGVVLEDEQVVAGKRTMEGLASALLVLRDCRKTNKSINQKKKACRPSNAPTKRRRKTRALTKV
jgi:hypothetical protein